MVSKVTNDFPRFIWSDARLGNSNRIKLTDRFHYCPNRIGCSPKFMVRHVSGCHSMAYRSSNCNCSRIRRFPRCGMRSRRGFSGLSDCRVATCPFASDRNRVTGASVDRMDFCKQRQNVFSAVCRPSDEQAMRSQIQIAATMNSDESWISIARVWFQLGVSTCGKTHLPAVTSDFVGICVHLVS